MQKLWQQWDSNPRPCGPAPETGALDHSATLSFGTYIAKLSSYQVSSFYWEYLKEIPSKNTTNNAPNYTFQTLPQNILLYNIKQKEINQLKSD